MSESGTPQAKTPVAAVPPVTPSTDPQAGAATPQQQPATPPEGDPQAKGNEDKWDAETRGYIESLRRENAGHRSTNKELRSKLENIEGAVTGKDPDQDPNELLEEANEVIEALTARNAVLEAGYENNIPFDKLDYFGYKIEQGVSELEEGEDLDISPIVQDVMRMGQSEPVTPPGGANTGTNPPKTGEPTTAPNQITVDQFKQMGFLAKAKLQRDQPQVYETLKAESFA